PDGVWMSEGCLRGEGDNDDLGDTGASHNVKGDVSRLTEFKRLPRLIPLFVATKAPINFITGRGVMTYTSDNGGTIRLEPVYYCPTAKCTLISIPAVLESGRSW
ncbi:hypothetical protein CROQUDRAFT_30161, partial [Cronartium quercuum f. sp. fusiforme G11]